MGKKSSDPADVAGAAKIEAKANREAAAAEMYANKANQFNYLGGVEWTPTYEKDPVTGTTVTRWTQENSLSPNAQAAVDPMMQQIADRAEMANALSGRIYDEMGEAPDFDQFGEATVAPAFGEYNQITGREDYVDAPVRGDYQDAAVRGDYREFEFDDSSRQAVEDAYYNKEASRLDARYGNEATEMEVNLRSKGLRPGDQAYDSAMASFGTTKNDAYEQARYNAIIGGGEESDRAYDQQFGVVDYFNQQVDSTYGQDVDAIARLDSQTDQTYDQELAAAEYANQQIDQTYNQGIGETEYANQLLDSEYDMRLGETEAANALRDKKIEEYISKRGFSLAEQDNLSPLNDLTTLAGLITGQGVGGKTDSGTGGGGGGS